MSRGKFADLAALVLLVLLAVGRTALSQTRGAATAAIQQSQSLGAAASDQRVPTERTEGPCTAIADFLHVDAVNCEQLYTKAAGRSLGSIIATVPDPERTNLGLYFDRTLDVIERAAENSGYSYDRHWIPWRVAPDKVPNRPADREQLEESARRRLEQPGLLLFRPDNQSARSNSPRTVPLLVWLVGETPTAGVSAHQMLHAATYARRLAPGQTELKVLGPTYSGGALSLSELAARIRRASTNDKLTFDVVSGSLSSQVAGAILNNSGLETESTEPLPKQSLRFRFRTTLHNDAYAIRNLLNFINTKLIDRTFLRQDRVGFLVESSTSLGQDAFPKEMSRDDFFVVRFPREIARLRNTLPALARGAGRQPLPAELAPLDLSDARPNLESPPLFSETQTLQSQHAMLRSILESLRREKARYLGVLATDVRDAIFLAQFVRHEFRDIRLFVLDADLLFIEALRLMPLEGTLAVTTYPLIGRNHIWASHGNPETTRMAFDSRYEQGIYNACILLLNGEPGLAEYTSPFTPTPRPGLWLTAVGAGGFWPVALLDSSPDPSTTETLMYTRPLNATGGAFRWPEAEPLTRLWLSVYLGLVLLVWMTLYFSFTRIRRRQRDRNWFEGSMITTLSLLVTLFMIHAIFCFPLVQTYGSDASQPPGFAFYSRLAVLNCAALLIGIFSCWTGLWEPWCLRQADLFFILARTHSPRRSSGGMSRFAWMLFATIRCWTKLWLPWPHNRAERPGRGRLIAFLTEPDTKKFLIFVNLAAIGSVAAFIFYWFGLSPDRQFFFVYRSLNLASGVSPGAPLLILGAGFTLCWWRDYEYWKLYGQRFARPPDGGSDAILQQIAKDFPGPDRDFESPPHSMFVWPSPPRRTNLGAAVWWLFFGIFRRDRILMHAFMVFFWTLLFVRLGQSLEGWIYDALFCLTLASLIALIFARWARVKYLWRQLQRGMLDQLERHPLRWGFQRLPPQYSGSPIWQGGGARKPYVNRARSIECLVNLSALDAGQAPGLIGRLPSLAPSAGDLRTLLIACAKEPMKQRELVSRLAKIADELIGLLGDHWQRPYSDSLHHAATARPESIDAASCSAFLLAEEFVTLRYYACIRYVTEQMRNLMIFVSLGFAIAFWAVNSYPFLAETRIWWLMFLLFVYLSIDGVILFARMDRHPLLCRITDTANNRLQRSFYLRVLFYGTIPAAVVVSSLFPRIGAYLYGILEPVFALVIR